MAEEGPCISARASHRHSPQLNPSNRFAKALTERLEACETDSNNNRHEKDNKDNDNDSQDDAVAAQKIFTIGTSSDDSNNENNDDNDEDVDDNKHDKMSEQRSESDSEMDSCDDFSDDQNRENAGEDDDAGVNITSQGEKAGQKSPYERARTGQSTLASFYGEDETSDTESPAGGNHGNGDTAGAPGDGSSKTKDEQQQKEPGEDSEREISLTEEEALLKLNDPEVVESSEMTERWRKLGVTDLKKLSRMDKTDPAVKRLFMRPRITTKEVKNINIDPDIKSTVNEFLKTNITNNFIISRVLRENYATFYQWLAGHLQIERNAWAARLRQTLDKLDHEHKSSVDNQHLVMGSGAKLRTLVQTCSTAMFGIGAKDSTGRVQLTGRTSNSMASVRESINKLTGTRPRPQQKAGPSFHYPEQDSAYQTRKNNFHQRLTALGRLNERTVGSAHLTQSSFNLVRIATPGKAKVNYESDPGLYPSTRDFYQSMSSDVEDVKRVAAMRGANNASTRTRTHSSKGKHEHSVSDTEEGNHTSHRGGSECLTSRLELDPDDDTPWGKVLSDSIDVLSEICETLVNERVSCLKMVGVKPNQCPSLVEVVSSYVQDRHSSGHRKRRDIEKRLSALEMENKTLVSEMNSLQHTLAEKNNDAMSLQKQLDKLESLVYESSKIKVNRCVGTDDNGVRLNANKPVPPKITKSPYGRDKRVKSPLGRVKLSKSPYVNDKMPQSINGVLILSPQGKKAAEEKKAELGVNGPVPDPPQAGIDPTSDIIVNDLLTVPATGPRMSGKEKSLIELSEEKLKTLKQRAKRLEDSLHDAISSMVKLNQSVPFSDTASVHSNSSTASTTNRPSRTNNTNRNSNNNTPKFWNSASSVYVKSSPARLTDTGAAPSPGVVSSKSIGRTADRQTVTRDIDLPKILLDNEKSSLLGGKSMLLSPHVMSERSPVPSSLRVSSDKNKLGELKCVPNQRSTDGSCQELGAKPSQENGNNTASEAEEETTDVEDNGGQRKDLVISGISNRKKKKVISRHKPAGKGVVSKCLRCQKIFNSVDNHKLACCYHPKEKERLEQYDQSGKLIRVQYGWKCCMQSQESEGCVYGQHV